MSALLDIDMAYTISQGGVGEMGKRHPSEWERLQASRLFTLLKERMPSWKIKRSLKWKGYKEGRILILVIPEDAFSPDPSKSEQFYYEGHGRFTDYCLRLNILMPVSGHPHFDMSLEIVGLEKTIYDKEHRVQKVTPTQFLAHTGCQYGFDIENKSLQLDKDTDLSRVVEEAHDFLRREQQETMSLLLFEHLVQPETIISDISQVEAFVDDLLEKGFESNVPKWLKLPLHPHPTMYSFKQNGFCFETVFQGVQVTSGYLTTLHQKVVLLGSIRLILDDDGLVVKVRAQPSSFQVASHEFVIPLKEKSHKTGKVTNRKNLEKLILKLMEEVVFDVYRRSKNWSKPVIWETT